jgi:HD superfamily phosphodiesterase
MISEELIQRALKEYTLPWYGIHGISHWARVLENSLRLAKLAGAKIEVVQLFALFHDAKRRNGRRSRSARRRIRCFLAGHAIRSFGQRL